MGDSNFKRRTWITLLSVAALASTACHRVIIDSGLTPTPEVYHEEWNQAFAEGIYPAEVDASEYCGGWWARVETRQSFLNGVVSAFTFGILTPLDVRVVCGEVPTDAAAKPSSAPESGLTAVPVGAEETSTPTARR